MLDKSALAGQAARELAEELGIGAAAEDLKLWVVTRGENGSIGLSYLAPALPEATLRADLTAAAAAERVLGREPELDDIALVRSPDELAGLAGPHADYLEPVVRRFSGCRLGQVPARKSRPRSSSSATHRRPRARKRARSLRMRETAFQRIAVVRRVTSED